MAEEDYRINPRHREVDEMAQFHEEEHEYKVLGQKVPVSTSAILDRMFASATPFDADETLRNHLSKWLNQYNDHVNGVYVKWRKDKYDDILRGYWRPR